RTAAPASRGPLPAERSAGGRRAGSRGARGGRRAGDRMGRKTTARAARRRCRPHRAWRRRQEGNYRALLRSVVGRFLRDGNVVDVAFTESCRGDANELRFALQLADLGAPAVAHARAQTADELVNHRADATLVGDATLDAFG